MLMSSEQQRGKKRSKAFYRKSAFGGKRHCSGANVLEPGIRGFLVTCNHDEKSAVRECYNILNEYADTLYGPDKNAGLLFKQAEAVETEDAGHVDEDIDEDCDDIEKALEKEVEELKKAASSFEKRFQNVATKAKNCVFIRTSLANPVEVISSVMTDIAEKHLKKARCAARILPILGTCKANTKEIEKLALDVLTPVFSKLNSDTPSSFTILFKMRNNNGSSCGRESVIPTVTQVVKDINPAVKLSWNDYSVAIVVEVVCTVCCIGVAPDYIRLRKYNLQELQQGPKILTPPSVVESNLDTTGKGNGQITSVSNDIDKEGILTNSVSENLESEVVENEVVEIKEQNLYKGMLCDNGDSSSFGKDEEGILTNKVSENLVSKVMESKIVKSAEIKEKNSNEEMGRDNGDSSSFCKDEEGILTNTVSVSENLESTVMRCDVAKSVENEEGNLNEEKVCDNNDSSSVG